MNAILLYDEIDIKKNQWFISHFIEESQKRGIFMTLYTSQDLYNNLFSKDSLRTDNPIDWSKLDSKPDFIINRSRDSFLSCCFEQNSIRSFNKSNIIKIANDKDYTYRYLKDVEHLPYVCCSIKELANIQKNDLPSLVSSLGFPLVIKPTDGHGGDNISLAINSDDYCNKIEYLIESENINRNYIFQKYSSHPGQDLRVYVMGNNILAGVMRSSDTDFRSNFSLGGKASLHNLSEEELTLVNKISSIFPADFIGIDFIYDQGKPVLNEIEDAVGCRMLYSLTDIDVIPIYLDYILKSL